MASYMTFILVQKPETLGIDVWYWRLCNVYINGINPTVFMEWAELMGL